MTQGSVDKSPKAKPFALRLLGLALLIGSVGLVSCQAWMAL